MFDWTTTPEGWLSLLTLTAMEIVLGIDNILFISILTGRLPVSERSRGRRWGLGAAAVSRLGLLLTIAWIVRLQTPLFTIAGVAFTGKSLILLGGGLFLLYKATKEIHAKLEGAHESSPDGPAGTVSFGALILQVMIIDIVFALDSVITAVGMTPHISLMVLANLLALGVMMVFADAIANLVERHPTIKMLALSFLLMIGMLLVGESLGAAVPKGYVYFAMGFSVVVEILNIRAGARGAPPVRLHETPRTAE